MIHTIINTKKLSELDKWNIKKIVADSSLKVTAYDYPVAPLGNLVKVRKSAITPSDHPDETFNYIGLENISKQTGLLKEFYPKGGVSIKSRSKIFKAGDILYGRLRPSLNKCLLVPGHIPEGICSTEIFVLKPKIELISPIVLSFFMRSHLVLDKAVNLVAGAALPRVQIKDFLNIKIPLPSIKEQLVLEAEMLEVHNLLEEYSKSLETYPDVISSKLEAYLKGCKDFELVNRTVIRTPLYDNPLPGNKTGKLFN